MTHLVQESQTFASFEYIFHRGKLIQKSVSKYKSCKFSYLNFNGALYKFICDGSIMFWYWYWLFFQFSEIIVSFLPRRAQQITETLI